MSRIEGETSAGEVDFAEHARTYREGLLEDTLGFWMPRALDREQGGYFTAFSRAGRCVDTDKSIWQQGRFAWLLAKLHDVVEARDEWLEASRHGIEFLEQHGFDEDGRMWFHVDRKGRPLRKRRYAFSEAFASIAFGAYAKISGDDEAERLARETFRRFATHSPSPPKTTDFRESKGIGAPMILLNVAQELRESIGFEEADVWIDRAVAEIRDDFMKPEFRAVMETVGPAGEVRDHFDGRTLNPGHAIECAWFMIREGRHRNDEELIRLGRLALEWSWARGWDREYGGLLHFVDLYGHDVQEYWHDMKFWWPHAEAILASLFAYAATGEGAYLEMYARVHAWTYEHFVDEVHGEWFGYLHRNGTVSSSLKGNLWKGPFHVPRMQLYAWRLCEEIAAGHPTGNGRASWGVSPE